MLAPQPDQRPGERPVERQVHPLRDHRGLCLRRPRREPRALLQARQRLAPGLQRRRMVLRGDERQIVAIRRHPRQRGRAAALRIGRQHLAHQHRRRPAVHQQVMVADQKPVTLRRQPDQRKPHQRRTHEVEPLRPVRVPQRSQFALLLLTLEPRQVVQPPRHTSPRHDRLHRAAQPLVMERRPQARVPVHHGLHRGLQQGAVQRAFQLELELHRIEVGALRVVERVEQQPLLQRRQRQDVLEPEPGAGSRSPRSRLASARAAAGRLA